MNSIKLTLLALSLMLASCAKKKIEPEEKIKTCNVKVLEYTHSVSSGITDKYYYTYDSDHRIIRLDYGKEQSSNYEVYTYAPQKITWNDYTERKPLVFTIDANGRVSEALISSNNQIGFKYNSDGYLIEVGAGPDKETFDYTNGNLTAVAFDSSPYATFEYGTLDNNNDLIYSLIYQNKYLYFGSIDSRVLPIGKKSKKLPVQIITSVGSGEFKNIYDYTYKTDDNGRVTFMSVKWSVPHGGSRTSEYKFIYECK